MSEKEARRVLVVDDEPDILTLIRFMLQGQGYAVTTADNGLDAVKMVYQEAPECIILDVMMPRMNGYQVCRHLKHDARTRDIPIILCTVKSLEMDRVYGMTAGADYYLTKPFDPGDLLKLVNDALRRQPAADRARPQNMGSSSTDTILSEINQLLDQKLREYTILQYVSRAIAGTLNLDDLLGIILRSVTTDLGYRRGHFLMLSEGDELEERLSTEERGDRPVWRGSLGALPGLGGILKGGFPRVMELRDVEGVLPPEIARRMEGTKVAVVPVVAKGSALGVILVEGGGLGGEFSEDMLGFFMTLAGQAGLAIENAQLYAKTLMLSITDGLTGLYNYRYFMQRLEAEFTRAKRYERRMALFIMDIDHFKDYNDRYGHLKGDEALRRLGDVLRRNIREVDVVARYGGEEFALILPETEIEEAFTFARRLQKIIDETWQNISPMTMSIGVAEFDPSMENQEELIRSADEALYEAKRQGRNRVCRSG